MRKRVIAVIVVLVVVQLLAIPVSAAAGNDLLVVEAIGGFFSDLIDTIVNLGKFIFESLIKAVEFLLTGLKKLFIPRDDFFPRAADRLYDAFQKKFGGILSLANYLNERFSDLRAYRGDLFVIQYPREHLFGGARIDILAGAEGIANMIRTALSGGAIIFTVAFAYKKVTAMINT